MNLRKLPFTIITLIISIIIINLTSCKKDEPDPIKNLTLSSLTAGNIDLINGTAENVSNNSSIVAVFSANLDITTVTASSITLTEGSEQAEVTLSAVGPKITITPKEKLKDGKAYVLNITSQIKSFEGGDFSQKTISFKVEGASNTDPLTIESIKAGNIDLNGTVAATDVSTKTEINITFSSNLNEATVNATSVTLSAGSSDISSSITASDNTIIVTPDVELTEKTEYTLTLANTLTSSEGGAFDGKTLTFITGSTPVTPPQVDHQVAFWRFNGNTNDYMGMQSTVVEKLSYDVDRHGESNAAGSFNGEGDILEIEANDNLINKDLTISMWVKIDTSDYSSTRYLLGTGVENGYYFEVLSRFENVSFTTRNDNGDGTADVQWGEESAIPLPTRDDIWTQLVITTGNDGFRRIYIDGTMIAEYDLGTKGIEFDDTIDGINANLAFGYVCSTTSTGTDWAIYEDDKSSTYKGMLDDIRVFDIVLTQAEITTLYNAEK